MKTSLTPIEKRIAEMVHTMDILTDEMNALLPSDIDSLDLEQWKELYNYRDDLYVDLYNTVEGYINEKAMEEDAEECWKNVADAKEKYTKALDTLLKVKDEDRITSEEYALISKPLKHELQDIQRFAIAKVLEKESIAGHSSSEESSNLLDFII